MIGLMLCLALLPTQAPTGNPAPAAATTTPAAPTTPAAATTPAAEAPVDKAKATTTAPGKADAAKEAPPGNPLTQFLIFVPAIVLFYFMMIRPQKQEEKKRKELLGRMQKNDRVVTTGGMYGTIVAVDSEQNTVTLRIGSDPGVKVEFTKASVVRVINPGDKKDGA